MEMGNGTRSARDAAKTDFDDFLAAQSGQGVPEVEGKFRQAHAEQLARS
jgi:hypothetical protein